MGSDLYIARLTGQRIPYGPIIGQHAAARFAAFLTAEVDPADVERLRDPVAELLGWHGQFGHPAEPAVIGYRIGDQVHDPADVTIIRRDDQVATLDVPGTLTEDGHRATCLRTDPHFFPKQCRP